MQNYTHVRPEHLNHHGYLFGGRMLMWVDEFAWMAAQLDFPGRTLVTISMDKVVFKKRVVNGTILRFDIQKEKTGRTSVQYKIEVFADEPGGRAEKLVFTNSITFVSIDEQGNSKSLYDEL